MRHATAVARLRAIAVRCQQAVAFWDDEPLVTAVYAFGDVVDGREDLDCVEVVLVINQPPAEVPLSARPEPYLGLAKLIGVTKQGSCGTYALRSGRSLTAGSAARCGSGR